MNTVVAAVYAITIGNTPLNDTAKQKLLDLVPVLVHEINRLQDIASDPFVRGYIEARKEWVKP